ncbi:HEAT repeat domain-containing protein [bacterium]|nr:HEAT repeat domain-containing protein [bacterium]
MKCLTMLVMTLFLLTGAGMPPGSAGALEKKMTAVEKLAKKMSKSVEYKRMLLLEKLSAMNTEESRGLIIQTMLEDRSKPVRRTAQRLLFGLDDPRIAGQIHAGLRAEKRKIRLAAVDVAGIVRDPEMANKLIAAAAAYPKDTELILLVMESLRELVYRMEPPKDFEVQVHPFLDHRHRKIRQTAVLVLSVMGRPASLQPLMAVWPKAGKKTKVHLIDAFSNMGRIAPVPLLLGVLQEKDKRLMMHALYALAQIQSFSTVPDIHRLLQTHQDPRVRMACLYALVEIPDPKSIPVILDVMESQDPTVLHWGTYALAQLGATSAGPKLLEKLDHPSNLVRATAVMALGELGVLQAKEPLRSLITNQDEASEVKVAAARALIKLGDSQGADVLWQELQSLEVPLDSRLAYAVAIGAIAKPEMKAAVFKDLTSSQFTRAFTAALILGVMGDPSGRVKLITALEHGYSDIRRFAIIGLEGILDDKSIRALADTANDDRDPLVRILCAAGLVKAGYKDFRQVLWHTLDTRDEDIRSEVIAGLGRSADDEILYQLKWYLKREPSIPVRQTIQRVIRENRDR